jgi:membrane-associated phospholipid phosphatase
MESPAGPLKIRAAEFFSGYACAMPELFHRLPRNVLTIFSGRNLLWHALAILLTIVIVRSGFDWIYFCWTRSDDAFARLARPAIIIGTFLPLVAILILLLVGAITKNRRLLTTVWALGQAALLGYLISCGYKSFTGRLPPPFHGFRMSAMNEGSLVDSSHGFQFGFLKGGVFWGWPSSHTTVTFAMMTCLIALWPKNKPLVFFALLYAFYIGLGVSVTIHWFSEFVAGAIIGSVIGTVVGRSFRAKLD